MTYVESLERHLEFDLEQSDNYGANLLVIMLKDLRHGDRDANKFMRLLYEYLCQEFTEAFE